MIEMMYAHCDEDEKADEAEEDLHEAQRRPQRT